MTKTAIAQLCVMVFVLGTFTGVYLEKKFNDSAKLSEERKQQKIAQIQDEASQKVAEKVLAGLSSWKQNTKDVVKEMHYEKVKPVFFNTCATDNYVRLWNSKQEYARKILAGELEAEVSNRPTKLERN